MWLSHCIHSQVSFPDTWRNGQIFSRTWFKINQFMGGRLCDWNECSKESHSFSLFNSTKSFYFRVYGILKGKMAIKLFKTYPNLKQKPYWGNHFWSRGYFVSTVGLDEAMIRRYVKYQEHHDSKWVVWPFGFNLKSKATVKNSGSLLEVLLNNFIIA